MINQNASQVVSEVMKVAEKYLILNDRQDGLLTRLHYMKNLLANQETRSFFLPGVDKTFDAGWKTLLKKFPNPDVKSSHSSLQPFLQYHKEILPQLSSFYFLFMDIAELNTHINEALTAFGSKFINLDITLNPDITKLYLNLVTNHFVLMVLLTRLSDVKAILALYNFLIEQSTGKSESNFHRMAEHFTQPLDTVLKSLHDEINPHARTLVSALSSVQCLLSHRTLRAKNWADGAFLNILYEPQSTSHTDLSDQPTCKLISYDTIERWIIFGYMMVHPMLNEDVHFSVFKTVLKNSYVIQMYRDEVVFTHSFVHTFMESVWNNRAGAKRLSELKDAHQHACSQASDLHNDRRTYLRLTLRQLSQVMAEEPGLLGPKAFSVFWGLSYAVDEITWLLRHYTNQPSKKFSSANVSSRQGSNALFEEMVGHYVPELLFYVDELRRLIVRCTPVIQRFYLAFLSGYDAVGLNQMLRDVLPRLSSKEIDIFNAILNQISKPSSASHQDDGSSLASGTSSSSDFSAVRLDWLRLQTYLSSGSSAVRLEDCRALTDHMNLTIYHTKLVDYLDELLRQTSDLSILYFYETQVMELSRDCRMCPSQMRFSIVFPSLCSQYVNACHAMCPEERLLVGQSAVRVSQTLLQQLADHICACVLVRIDEFGALADQLSSHHAVPLLAEDRLVKKKKQKGRLTTPGSKAQQRRDEQAEPNRPGPAADGLPGQESLRRRREDQTVHDKTLYALSQLCASANHHKELVVYNRTLQPREVLQDELQQRLIDILGKYTMLVPTGAGEFGEESIITKPSDLLRRLRALVDVVIGLEQHVCIDAVQIHTTVFSQHSQARDSFRGEATMAAHYAKWYCEVFLKHAQADHFVYSPALKSFITMATPDVVRFRAEDYADYNELYALAELIGPMGVRFLCDQVMQDVGQRLDELKRLVLQNRATLEALRDKLESPARTRQLAAGLQRVDHFGQLLKEIGVALALRRLAMEALGDATEKHAPFLRRTLGVLRQHVCRRSQGLLVPPEPTLQPDGTVAEREMRFLFELLDAQLKVSNVSAAMGVRCELDYAMCSLVNHSNTMGAGAIKALEADGSATDLDFRIANLLAVFVAHALPRLVRSDSAAFRIDLDACTNNAHCVGYAVNSILISMVSMLHPGACKGVYMHLLALCSSNLLRMGLEHSSSSMISSDISGNGYHSGGPSGSGSAGMQDSSSTYHVTQASQSYNKHRDSIFLIFHQLLAECPFLEASLQEVFFPYSLVRSAYHNLAKLSKTPLIMMTNASNNANNQSDQLRNRN